MLKSNGSSAWRIRPVTLMMFSCNSGFKGKILLFDDTVCVVLSERYSSGKDLTCTNLQMILMPSSKSFGDKYEKLIQKRGSVYAAIFCLPNLF